MNVTDFAAEEIRPLNCLLVQALLALARAGEAEQASRIAAQGWSLLRHRDPREAERLSAALHTLTRGLRVPSPL